MSIKGMMEFAEKKGYLKNGFLINKTIKEVDREFRENHNKQKKYYAVKDKQKKGYDLTPSEKLDIGGRAHSITW